MEYASWRLASSCRRAISSSAVSMAAMSLVSVLPSKLASVASAAVSWFRVSKASPNTDLNSSRKERVGTCGY